MVDVVLTGTGAPPDIQYFLDGSLECFDIPPDVYLWGQFFCPNVGDVIDSFDSQPELQATEHSRRLANYGARLERMYLAWQEVADVNAVALCLAYGVTYLGSPKQILREVTNTLVDDQHGVLARINYYEDLVKHRKDGLVYYDGLKMFERKRHFLESRFRIKAQWDALTAKPDFNDINIIRPRFPQAREIREYLGIERKAPEKSKKKALKRSAKLLDSITGESTVKLFLSGEEVSVTGSKYRFSLTKPKYSSIAGSHGSAETKVYDAQTDEFICGLCVYTPNVTVFDHLASIVLHCKSGLEDVIIEEANITTRGNLELLPEAKRIQIATPNGYTRADALDAIEIIENRGDNISAAIYGPHWRQVLLRKPRVDQENERALQKLTKRVMKKFPHLFTAQAVRIPRVADLFYGPEIFE